jgi:DNA-binding transcriptional LysR family regulator
MELRHARYFVAVAEELHFGRAAERLLMAQPPLSQQIQNLEEELGVQLFLRTKRRVQLTEAGKAFLPQARLMLQQAEQAIQVAQRASRGETGSLTVGFVGSACYALLPPLLRRFRENYPDVHVTLHELTTSQQVQELQQHRLHVGLLRPPISDTALRVETIFREALIVALPNDHPLISLSQVPLRMLANEAFILFPPTLGPGFYHQIISICLQVGFTPRVAQEAVQMQTIVSLVAGGMGIALVPASLLNLQRVGVAYRPLQEETPLFETAMAWSPDDPSPILPHFLEISRNITK